MRSDDSAGKERDELNEELVDAKKDLKDTVSDHTYQQLEDEIDADYEAEETKINADLKKIDDYLENPEQLKNDAMTLIRNQSVDLYGELVAWNTTYGDGITSTITTAWNDAYEALSKYSDLANIQAGIASATGNTSPLFKTSTVTSTPTVTATPTSTTGTTASTGTTKYTIVKGDTMSGIAKKYDTTLAKLKKLNPNISDYNRIYTGQKINVPKYHIGLDAGFVGGSGNEEFLKLFQALSGSAVNSDEQLALLQNGETAVTSAQQSNIVKNLTGDKSFTSNISNGMGNINYTEGDFIVQGNATEQTLGEYRKIKKELFNDFKALLNNDIRRTGYNLNAKTI